MEPQTLFRLCGNVVLNNKDKLPINDLPLSIKHVLDSPCCLLLPGLEIEGTYLSAESGHFSCFKEALDNGYTWNAGTIMTAAYVGNLSIIVYAYENGCSLNSWRCIEAAARNGHLECIKYMHEKECPWTEKCIEAAARNGHLECIKYMHENDCDWNAICMKEAMRYGHLECIKYMHENGCDLDWDCVEVAWKRVKENDKERRNGWYEYNMYIIHEVYMKKIKKNNSYEYKYNRF